MSSRPKIVIVGAGFGGIKAAKQLGKANADVTVIDRGNHHLFQPLLYQVATAGLTPADIAGPIRSILRKNKNTTTLMCEVTGIDQVQKQVLTSTGPVPYDYLILATGARHSYFAHPEWEETAPGLKSLDDAIRLRHQILRAFELAELEPDPKIQAELLTFAVVGAGPTGVEMAGAIAELARLVLKDDFRRICTAQSRVVLIEAGPRILTSFDESLSAYAKRSLEHMGVEVKLNTKVLGISTGLIQTDGEAIPTRTVVWAAGVAASPAAKWLGIEPDRAGRVPVNPDCSVPGADNIFVIGDTMSLNGANGKPLPGVSPVAMQQGAYVAKLIRSKIGEGSDPGVFQYWDKGNMATIGRKSAVVSVGKIKLTGFIAWLAWLVVHVWYLISFESKLLVILQWAWAYFTFRRRSRLIHGGGGLQRSSSGESP